MTGGRQHGFPIVLALALLAARDAKTQTIDGGSLSHRSSGSGASDWTLSENGYVGTYFTLAAPGSVTLSVNASGSTNDGVAPRMGLVVADSHASFDVTSGFSSYSHTFDLPAGTYFVRTEFSNDAPTANRQLTVRNLSISGATSVSNSTSATTNDANALAAADSYIANYRRGPASIALSGLAPGTQAQVRMVRNAFNFGTMVQGFDANVFLAPLAPGDTTSTAARYQNFINQYFNILVPSNMGKWQPNENTQGQPTMNHVDTILNYAQTHNMNVRMHNLIWGNQQPAWVNTLITNAQSSNPTVAATAKADLMQAIANRIAYYVGDGDADTSDGDRSQKYLEIDVLNEALRNDTYYKIFGYEGIAQIHKMVLDAVSAAGAETRLYTNEYNVLQYSNDPSNNASDPYANWYRRQVEGINSGGYGAVVTGVGVQYNIDPRTSISQPHSPARIAQVMHNLSVTGLPITLTEFAVQPSVGGVTTTQARSAQVYSESSRMLFGTPQATSFLIWEAWPPATTDNTTIVDSNWNLTQSGQALVNLLNSWKTPTQNLLVGPNGKIDFTGYYGDYEITVGGQSFGLSLVKGTEAYSLVVAPGDYNGDGTVDAADYNVWRDSLGSTDDLRADGNGDLVIGDGDLSVWQSAFGTTYAFGAGGLDQYSVPEPLPLGLTIVAGVLRHRRNRNISAARSRLTSEFPRGYTQFRSRGARSI